MWEKIENKPMGLAHLKKQYDILHKGGAVDLTSCKLVMAPSDRHCLKTLLKIWGESPVLVIMGGREFESPHHILDAHFFTYLL